MGRLNVPPTVNPATNVRKAPASGGVGNETKANMDGAFEGRPGPGKSGVDSFSNLSLNSGELHKTLGG